MNHAGERSRSQLETPMDVPPEQVTHRSIHGGLPRAAASPAHAIRFPHIQAPVRRPHLSSQRAGWLTELDNDCPVLLSLYSLILMRPQRFLPIKWLSPTTENHLQNLQAEPEHLYFVFLSGTIW